MLPRFYLLLIDCPDEAQLHLLSRQHQQDWTLCIGVDTLDGEEAVILGSALLAPLLRTFQKSAVNLHFGLTFLIQGQSRRLADPLADVDELLE